MYILEYLRSSKLVPYLELVNHKIGSRILCKFILRVSSSICFFECMSCFVCDFSFHCRMINSQICFHRSPALFTGLNVTGSYLYTCAQLRSSNEKFLNTYNCHHVTNMISDFHCLNFAKGDTNEIFEQRKRRS